MMMPKDGEVNISHILSRYIFATGTSPEHIKSISNVKELALQLNCPVVAKQGYHSDTYPTGSKGATLFAPFFYAR